MQQTKTAIVWFTNNLRIHDNETLHKACVNYDRVIGIYCYDPSLFETTQFGFKKTGKFRQQFLEASVQDLKENLSRYNISLYTCYEHPHISLPKFCFSYKADALFFQKEFTTEEVDEVQRVKSKLPKEVKIYENYDQFLFHPDDIQYTIETIPEVFTVFRKRTEKYVKVRQEFLPIAKPKENYIIFKNTFEEERHLPRTESIDIPPHTAFPFEGGESSAIQRLQDYFFTTKKLSFYKKTRNGLLGTDYSSKFSSWLANGSISAKTIYWEVKRFEKEFGSNQSTYWMIFELIWRDYFKYLSLKHEANLFKLEGIKRTAYEWKTSEKLVAKWINGETDEPFVNANMVELKQTGWMSNRGRQNVASYLTKELLVDWRIGAAYFESMLIDYDVHSNYGNWQYVAGVGNDPRNRKFNIKLQAERYDTKGAYQSLWLQPTLF